MSALYIYYRVQAPCPAALPTAVHAMQARLRAGMPGLAASLHRKIASLALVSSPPITDTTSPPGDTWMEIYQFNGHPDHRAWASFEAALSAEVSLLPGGIDGLRHAERFELLPPSAHAGSATLTVKA